MPQPQKLSLMVVVKVGFSSVSKIWVFRFLKLQKFSFQAASC
jgi:hypothetical protein